MIFYQYSIYQFINSSCYQGQLNILKNLFFFCLRKNSRNFWFDELEFEAFLINIILNHLLVSRIKNLEKKCFFRIFNIIFFQFRKSLHDCQNLKLEKFFKFRKREFPWPKTRWPQSWLKNKNKMHLTNSLEKCAYNRLPLPLTSPLHFHFSFNSNALLRTSAALRPKFLMISTVGTAERARRNERAQTQINSFKHILCASNRLFYSGSKGQNRE